MTMWGGGGGGEGQMLFKQFRLQGGHVSSEDTKGPEFDLSRGIRISMSEHTYILNECQLHG